MYPLDCCLSRPTHVRGSRLRAWGCEAPDRLARCLLQDGTVSPLLSDFQHCLRVSSEQDIDHSIASGLQVQGTSMVAAYRGLQQADDFGFIHVDSLSPVRGSAPPAVRVRQFPRRLHHLAVTTRSTEAGLARFRVADRLP